MFEPGTLWRKVLERADRAVRVGALRRIPTRSEHVEQGGVRFLVPVVESLALKKEAGRIQDETGTNPFLPHERDLFVSDISDTHICLLNKFNVVEHHLLIVTREFEDQEALLNLRDFEAMWTCLFEFDGLAFYNAGVIAGASQRHKHLQQVPVPLGDGPVRTPMDPLLASANLEAEVGALSGLPFVHAFTRIERFSAMKRAEAARATLALYHEMRRVAGLVRDSEPYNLLVTRDWMLLVPRSRETFETISVNALGFAGSLLARNDKELELVRKNGPMAVLRHVSVARD